MQRLYWSTVNADVWVELLDGSALYLPEQTCMGRQVHLSPEAAGIHERTEGTHKMHAIYPGSSVLGARGRRVVRACVVHCEISLAVCAYLRDPQEPQGKVQDWHKIMSSDRMSKRVCSCFCLGR